MATRKLGNIGHSPDGTAKGQGRERDSELPEIVEDEQALSQNGDTDANPRKRKRTRREPDQKHVCNAPGCGKTYSRAEHLYRHQLNRA
jgi:hypothetical protein